MRLGMLYQAPVLEDEALLYTHQRCSAWTSREADVVVFFQPLSPSCCPAHG